MEATLESVLLVAAAVTSLLLWTSLRVTASGNRRAFALWLIVGSVLWPAAAVSTGLIGLQSASVATLLLLVAAALEVTLIPSTGRPSLSKEVRRFWAAALVAVGGFLVLALPFGVLPSIYSIELLVALLLAAWMRVDRALLQAVIVPAWLTLQVFMLAALPLGLLNAAAWRADGDIQETAESSAAPYTNLIWTVLGVDERWAGVFSHPNTLGAFAALGFAISLTVAPIPKSLLIGSVLLAALSSSRTAALAMVASALVFAFLRSRGRSRWLISAVGGVVAFSALTSVLTDGSLRTGTGRYAVWHGVLDSTTSSWVIGLGPRGSEILQAEGVLPDWASSPHSIWFNGLLTAGVVGLLLTVGVFVAAAGVRQGYLLLAAYVVLASFDNTGNLNSWGLGGVTLIAIAAAGTANARDEQFAASPLRAAVSDSGVGCRRDP